jgi:hypothetical protein
VIPDSWSQFTTWHYVLPPSRPSERELKAIKRLVGQRGKPLKRAAVLGSTPEFRDLLVELECPEIVVFERNAAFYEQIQKLRVYPAAPETVVWGEWLKMLPAYANAFDLVLSDLTSGNIRYQEREEFYRSIGNALNEGGQFYDKVLTHSNVFISLDEIRDKYASLPPNLLHINQFSCEALFCSELIRDSRVVDTSEIYRTLESELTSPRLATFVKLAELVTPRGCLWYYGAHWTELAPSYCTGLASRQIMGDVIGSPYYGRLRVFWNEKEG